MCQTGRETGRKEGRWEIFSLVFTNFLNLHHGRGGKSLVCGGYKSCNSLFSAGRECLNTAVQMCRLAFGERRREGCNNTCKERHQCVRTCPGATTTRPQATDLHRFSDRGFRLGFNLRGAFAVLHANCRRRRRCREPQPGRGRG